MRKIALSAIAAIALLASCSEGNKRVPVEEVNFAAVITDSMIYGSCSNGSAMNTLQIVTDADDTITLDLADARERGLVHGGYAVGDEMAVMVNSDTTEARLVINESELLGNWVIPAPADGSAETGISIQKGGTAKGIEQTSLTYKSWRLFNGQLQIVATRADDTEETLAYTITHLSTDSLAIFDGEYTHGYNRQKN